MSPIQEEEIGEDQHMFDSGEGEIVEVILHEDAVAHGDIMDIDEAEGGMGMKNLRWH